jgi:hypothetical protein
MQGYRTCVPHQLLLGQSNKSEGDKRKVWQSNEKRNVYRVLVATPGGKRPLGKPLRRWEYSITIDLN